MKKCKLLLIIILAVFFVTGCSKRNIISEIKDAEIATVAFSIDPTEPTYKFSGTEVDEIVSLIKPEKWKPEKLSLELAPIEYINFYKNDDRYILGILNIDDELMLQVSSLKSEKPTKKTTYYIAKGVKYNELMDSLRELCSSVNEIPDYNSIPSAESEITERIVYETLADLNHDGIKDLVQLVVSPDENGVTTEELLVKRMHLASIRVFGGIDGETFEIQPCYESREYSIAHAGNGTVCLTEKDGLEYLMFSSAYEMQGRADYFYNVFYFEDGKAVTMDYGSASFVTDCQETGMSVETLHEKGELLRTDAIPEYKEKMMPWIENGKIIISLDIEHYDTPLLMSTGNRDCPATEYFDLVWSRGDLG